MDRTQIYQRERITIYCCKIWRITIINIPCEIFADINRTKNFRPDYAPWSGPDHSLLSKQPFSRSLAIGHDETLISTNHCLAKGPQSELRKGPIRGLAQGSIYSQRNVANTESRGK